MGRSTGRDGDHIDIDVFPMFLGGGKCERAAGGWVVVEVGGLLSHILCRLRRIVNHQISPSMREPLVGGNYTKTQISAKETNLTLMMLGHVFVRQVQERGFLVIHARVEASCHLNCHARSFKKRRKIQEHKTVIFSKTWFEHLPKVSSQFFLQTICVHVTQQSLRNQENPP